VFANCEREPLGVLGGRAGPAEDAARGRRARRLDQRREGLRRRQIGEPYVIREPNVILFLLRSLRLRCLRAARRVDLARQQQPRRILRRAARGRRAGGNRLRGEPRAGGTRVRRACED